MKSLVPAEQFAQIAPKRVFIGYGQLQDGMKMGVAFLINPELLKVEIPQANRAIMRIEPNHNGRFRESKGQGAESGQCMGQTFAAHDHRMEKYGIASGFQFSDKVDLPEVVV